ncbi:MAG: hypothetical protein M5U22_18565 [Thermoleophilia bacterium]|nr:hypothetical protein [Thermoleophilia bacterium]
MVGRLTGQALGRLSDRASWGVAKLYHDDTIDADEITLSIHPARKEVAPAA